MRGIARNLGLEMSLRTVQRILAGEISAVGEVTSGVSSRAAQPTRDRGSSVQSPATEPDDITGPILSVGAEDLGGIRAILQRAARSSYLELAGLDIEARPGEFVLRAQVYEQEDEYEQQQSERDNR